MMQKPISPADAPAFRITVVTMDSHLAGAMLQARGELRREIPGLELSVHAADEWAGDEVALAACHDDIARADIVIAAMLFLEDHIAAVLPALKARRASCDAMVCLLSAGEVMRLTRLGRFDMGAESGGVMGLLKKLRGSKKGGTSSGAGQMKMLRELPRLLRFIPGTAQDVRAYFLALQYWLAGSRTNLANLVRLLVNRYAAGARQGLAGTLKVAAPEHYPDVGLYHPRLPGRVGERPDQLPAEGQAGTVGLLVMRSYVLAGNAAHYDGVIAALEARGLRVIPAFASGLDNRPAIERFFMRQGVTAVDAVVSLTGFSLVGGPAYNDARAAEELLARLDVPYVSAHPLEFQTMRQWQADPRGLLPIEATMMVAIPRTRWRHLADDLWRPLRRRAWRAALCRLRWHELQPRDAPPPRAHRASCRPRRQARRSAQGGAPRAQGRDGAVQLSAQCRQHRDRGLPRGFRVPAQHAAGHGRCRLRRGRAGGRGRAPPPHPGRQHGQVRIDCQRGGPHRRGRSCAA
jgi:magnesium chelatase subunit H